MSRIIGVDEAGRGPLAGPVAVGVVLFPHDFKWESLNGVRDSKQLSAQRREEWFERMEEWHKNGIIIYSVVLRSARDIDTLGITKAINESVVECVRAVAPNPAGVKILLDGLLKAPKEYEQKTIIHGDETEPAISFASIAAKVVRDRYMCSLVHTYPQYGFERHKGYGTKEHYAMIKKHGACEEHRKSFRLYD